jgi:hypothetical protein
MSQALTRTNVTLSDRHEVDEGDVILDGTQTLSECCSPGDSTRPAVCAPSY